MNARERRSGMGEVPGGWVAVRDIGRSAAWLSLLAILMVAASPARAATVTCPDAPLLSEEIARAGSVFVGEVRGDATEDRETAESGPVVDVLVEEIWRGPALASTVRVSNPLYAGAPRIDLVTGGRYLFLAEPAGGPGAGEPVADLILQACSLTRPLSPDLAGLRPADAVVMPAFEPVPASTAEAPIWPWALVGALVVLTAAAFLLRGRLGMAGRWLPRASGAATVAAVALGIGLTLTGPGSSSSRVPAAAASPASATPATTSSGVPATPSIAPATPAASPTAVIEDPTLVVRISDSGTMPGAFGRYVSIHADGRVIATSRDDTIVQRRLTAGGLDRIRDAVAASEMFGQDAPAAATYTAVLRSDAESPQRGAFGERIVAGRGEGTVSVDWTPIFDNEVDLWQPSAEIARLDELAALLWALDEWLPADAWLEANAGPYEATRFRFTDDEIGMMGYTPPTALADLDWPLDTPLAELPATRNPVGLLNRCLTLTRAEAVEVVGRLARLFGDPTLGLGSRLAVELSGEVEGRVHRLSIEPLMPDESGCGSADPTAADAPVLGPGAIALVRVDGLRLREAPSARSRALDAFRAGERVAVVTESTAEDGTRWWLVRQGPGDRQGWVNSGPPGEDPWLVAIGNGAIAFLGQGERVGAMQADGSDPRTIADGYPSGWSPDGARLLIAVPSGTGAGESDIATIELDGSGQRRLASGGLAVWSPDGSRIAFSRSEDGESWVYVMRSDGSDLERVARGQWLAWSPDGTRLAVTRIEVVERPQDGGYIPAQETLWLLDLDSGSERRLTEPEVSVSNSLAWAPDGSLIAFGDRLIAEDGTEVLRLDLGDMFSEQPWSPHGEDLAVIDADPSGADVGISLLSVDTGELRTLVAAGAVWPTQVAWSPDGRVLTLTADDDDDPEGRWRIMAVAVDGGEVFTIGPEESQFAAWQPIVSHPLD